jgi:3'-5' exoribonuclease
LGYKKGSNIDMLKKQFINDLVNDMPVDSVFVVSRKNVRQKKNKEEYCTLTLSDKSGNIESVIWTEGYRSSGMFNEGDFVRACGQVSEYRGLKQLTLNKVTKVTDKALIDENDFIKVTKKDIKKMFSDLRGYIDIVQNRYVQELLRSFFYDKTFSEKFCNATAASRNHHAYRGGLLEHTLSVTKISDYLSGLYENMNRDVILCGSMLHDIGKIEEYDVGAAIKMNNTGKLIGHIVIAYNWIEQKISTIESFPEDLRQRLLHVIISHHGFLEYGSPKEPKTIEAFAVYHADHLDADINGFNTIIEESCQDEEWSSYARNFERSVLLKKMDPGNDQESKKPTPQEGLF